MQKRKLGLTEYYSKYCHDHANGTTLLTGMIQVKGPLSSGIMEKALLMMQQRHSILRSYFTESTKKADYIPVDEEISVIPLSTIKRESGTQWKEIFESSSMTLFSAGDRYLWRVVFLEGNSSLAGKHEISDGVSAGIFLGELLENCSDIESNVKSSDSAALELLPPVEELLTKKISWGGFLLNVILMSGKYMKYIKHLDRFEKYATQERRRHRNVYREIDAINEYNLIRLCRDNNTTITALLLAVLSKVAFNVRGNNRTNSVQFLVTPINVRERCNPVVAGDRIGCYVDFIDTALAIDKEKSLWELSRSFREQLMNGIERGGHMPVKYSKSLVKNIFSGMGKGILSDVFHYGIGVTNIGKVDLKSHCGPYEVKYFSFSTGRQWGDWMILLHIATVEDRMYLCFCFAEPLISQATVDSIANQVISTLNTEHCTDLKNDMMNNVEEDTRGAKQYSCDQ